MQQLQTDLEAVLAASRQVEAVEQQLAQLTEECERLRGENRALQDHFEAHASAEVSAAHGGLFVGRNYKR